MTKIICTVTNDLTYDQRMIRICTSLANASYEVLLVGRLREHSKPLKQQPFQQKRLKCFFDKGKFFYIEYNIRLFFFLLFQRFDIVNSIDLDTILPGFYISKIKSKLCIYDAHEYFTEVPEVVPRPTIQKIWKWVEKTTIPKLKYCYTVGDGLADLFQKEYKTTFKVIRNVPWQLDFKTTTKQSKKILLYQGALNEGRGLEALIETMQYIENAYLYLAGEGDLSKELRALAKEKKVIERVVFLGFIQPHELKSLTNRAYIGLNLLENKGLSYYYSLANKAFDYIQARKPSINMAFPEYTKLNEQFGAFHLIENLKTETLIEAIQQLLNDEDYYRSLVNKCDIASATLIWEEEEKKLLSIYKTALQQSNL